MPKQRFSTKSKVPNPTGKCKKRSLFMMVLTAFFISACGEAPNDSNEANSDDPTNQVDSDIDDERVCAVYETNAGEFIGSYEGFGLAQIVSNGCGFDAGNIDENLAPTVRVVNGDELFIKTWEGFELEGFVTKLGWFYADWISDVDYVVLSGQFDGTGAFQATLVFDYQSGDPACRFVELWSVQKVE